MRPDSAEVGGAGAVLMCVEEICWRASELAREQAEHGASWFLWDWLVLCAAAASAAFTVVLITEHRRTRRERY